MTAAELVVSGSRVASGSYGRRRAIVPTVERLVETAERCVGGNVRDRTFVRTQYGPIAEAFETLDHIVREHPHTDPVAVVIATAVRLGESRNPDGRARDGAMCARWKARASVSDGKEQADANV